MGEPRRIWTVEVCTGCGQIHQRDRWTSCPAPGFSHSAGGDLYDAEKVDVVPRSVVEAVFGRSASPVACLMQEVAWFLRDYAATIDDSPHPRLDGIRRDVEAALREAGVHS